MCVLSSIGGRSGFVVVVLVVVCFFSLPVNGQPWDGNGVEGGPYLIYTAADMQAIGADANYWDAHFELMADIDLSAYTGTSFNIIGFSWEKAFAGVFDGNGHTISNFSYDSNNTDNIGIFGCVSWTSTQGAKIKDVGLIDPNIDAGTGNTVGSLVGLASSSSTITGCYVEGGSISGNHRVGGLVGHNGWLSNCYSTASVSGIENVGGLFGSMGYCKMTNCYSRASVSGTTNVGGLLGHNSGWGDGVTNCYSKASVSGAMNVGGLVGRNAPNFGGTALTNCYSEASVSGAMNVGGLVGSLRQAGISKCYSAGSVSGDVRVGGLLGYKETGWVTDSFWDVNTSGQETSAGGDGVLGLPTAQMQNALFFTLVGWDFVGESANGTDDFWDICDGTNYPRLAWQIPIAGDFMCPDGVDMMDATVLCEQWLFYEIPDDVLPDGGDGIVNFFDWTVFADGWPAENDMYDLADFVGQWLKTGQSYLITDIAPYSGDGITNMADFAVVADNWLEGI